jgi:serine/threonine-protein kinase
MVRAGAVVVVTTLALAAGHAAGGESRLAEQPAAKVAVRRVVGMKQRGAEARLRAHGLRFAVRTAVSSKPAGTVLAQSPNARKRVARGTTVHLTVAVAAPVATPETISVPNVVGLLRDAAEGKLSAAGLDPSVSLVYSLLAVGSVVAQDPDPGEHVARSTQVRISVSRGPGP